MKTINIFLFALVVCFATSLNVAAQCTGTSWNFDEDDFAPGSLMATEAAPTAGPTTTNAYDMNADGTDDVTLTYTATLLNPNPGACADGDFMIGAGWGGTPALSTSSDFAGTTSDDCVCEMGYIVMTADFINGWNTSAADFEFNGSSQNGSSEGYEFGFGFVTAATDALGTPIAGLNTTAAVEALIATYCNAEYVAGTTISAHSLASATGIFTLQADDLNASANNCSTSSQNGEDTGSGSGPNSGLTTGVSGLAATDLITQVTYIYGLSNAPGSDCDADGDTGVGTNPSGSFSGIEGCYVAPCGFIADVALVEDCGFFDIEITNVTALDVAQATFNINYGTSATGPWTAGTTGNAFGADPYTLDVNIAADGATQYYVQLVDGTDSSCTAEFGPFTAPTASTPSIISYPANN